MFYMNDHATKRSAIGAIFALGVTNLAFIAIFALNAVHPFVHGLEGGALDPILHNLDGLLLGWQSVLPWHDPAHCDDHN